MINRQGFQYLGLVVMAIGLLGLSACNEGGDLGDIFQMSLSNGAGSIEVTANNSGNVLVIPFSSPSQNDISGSATYTLQAGATTAAKISANESIAPKSATTVNSTAALARIQARLLHERQQRLELQHTLQSFRQAVAQNGKLNINALYQPQSHGPGTPLALKTFDTTLNIFSPFDGEKNNAITGTLLANTETVALYLDSRDTGSLTANNAVSILQSFSGISLPRIHTLVGNESDINNDGGVVIFLSSKMPNTVLGFFRPIDLLPDGVDPTTKSNGREILYAQLPSSAGGDALFHATLAHEMFHLVNFAVKSLPSFISSGGSSILLEELFLNEGQAHLMEDLAGWGNGDTYAVAGEFLTNINKTSIAGDVDASLQGDAGSGDVNDTIARRGAAMLFLRYVFEQTGGAAYSNSDPGALSGGGITFFKSLTSSGQIGVPNIEAASNVSFNENYSKWVATLYLDGTGLTNDAKYNYQAIETDPFTLGPRGFDMQGSRQINGGTSVDLNGPAIVNTLTPTTTIGAQSSGTIFASGPNFLITKLGSNGKSTLSFQTSDSLSPGVTIIVLP